MIVFPVLLIVLVVMTEIRAALVFYQIVMFLSNVNVMLDIEIWETEWNVKR